jgi:hypothetical protein
MKQLTTRLPVEKREGSMNQLEKGRRSADSGFAITRSRAGLRRRMLDSLRPEGGLIPLDLDLLEIVAELDPGMIDWQGAYHIETQVG